jgi:Transmembrane protein 43
VHEEYTEITHVSWFSKLTDSCFGAIVGLLLFVASFFVLFWNEGRLNQAEFAKSAVDVSTIASPTAAQGKFVSASGFIRADSPLDDDLFLLPGKYIVVNRTVEMYAWKETKNTEREKHAGGSETQVTTYSYDSEWANQPEDSKHFRYEQNHRNPPKPFADKLFKVPSAQIGRYAIDINSLSNVTNYRASCATDQTGLRLDDIHRSIQLPKSGWLTLTAQNSRAQGKAIRTADYIFQGKGAPQTPQIGDTRVCYSVLPAEAMVTVFGGLEQSTITPYAHKDTQLLRLIPGTRTAAIAALGQEEALWRWLLRFTGFFMMWIGLLLMSSPLVAVLDVIPFLGWFAEGATALGSLLVAFVLSVITMVVSSMVHHPIALLLSVCVTLTALLILRRLRRSAA